MKNTFPLSGSLSLPAAILLAQTNEEWYILLEVSVSKTLLILASLMETIFPCKSLSSNGSWNDPRSPLSQHRWLALHRILTRTPPQTFPRQDLPRRSQPSQLDSPCSLGQHIFQCKSEIVDQSDYSLTSSRNFCIINSHVDKLSKMTVSKLYAVTSLYSLASRGSWKINLSISIIIPTRSTRTSPFKFHWSSIEYLMLQIALKKAIIVILKCGNSIYMECGAAPQI